MEKFFIKMVQISQKMQKFVEKKYEKYLRNYTIFKNVNCCFGLEFAELNICELKFRFKNSEKYLLNSQQIKRLKAQPKNEKAHVFLYKSLIMKLI